MLTISLDEYGDFEGIRNVNKPVFIAGLLYDDHEDERDTRLERGRIRAYYKAVIREAKEKVENPIYRGEFTYPGALHSEGNTERDHEVVRLVKQTVYDTLPEFLRRGTYRGSQLQYENSMGNMRNFEDRRGKYHVFTVLKSREGMSRLLGEHANILVKDDYASNLYFHMANEVVTRLIFYNPLIEDVKNVSLNIASRTSANFEPEDDRAMEYKKLEYTEKSCRRNGQRSQVYFNLTNADIYRTVIAEEILDAGKIDFQITDFHVTSIDYRNEDAQKMEFLYLADSICSILGFRIDGTTEEEWLAAILERSRNLTGREENLIFGYDEVDRRFSKAWRKFLEEDYYKALSILFDAGKIEGAFADHYRNQWFKKLEEHIVTAATVSGFKLTVRKLAETLRSNSLDQEKCLYILEILERIVPVLNEQIKTPEARAIFYQLYDIGVTAYCHIGDSINAERCFKECMKFAGLVSLDDYLSTRNKMVVFYCDSFAFEKAKEIAEENTVFQEMLMEFKEQLPIEGTGEAGRIALGKAYSQRGQIYAFLGKEIAEGDFRKALEIFSDDSANEKITQSYLLHYYLDRGKADLYREESRVYFGGNEKLADQFRYLLEEGAKKDATVNMKYGLYVFVKGLYLFRRNELTKKLWSDLQKTEEKFRKKIKNREWKLTGHPAELIFKYLSLLAYAKGEPELGKIYEDRMKECLRYHGATEDAIRLLAEAEIAIQRGNAEERDLMTEELGCFLKEKFPVYRKAELPQDGEERLSWLQRQIPYMYC